VSLLEIARKYGPDKIQHGYLPYYERHIPTSVRSVLEVGVFAGASLRTWAEWLPYAQVTGVDIKPLVGFTHPRIDVITADINTWIPARDGYTDPFDVIIDDGSHMSADIVAMFQRMWPFLNPGGWYVIEDLETQWYPGHGGGPDGSDAIDLITARMRDSLREVRTEVEEFPLVPADGVLQEVAHRGHR
jgi:spermidine synthase